MGEIVRYLHNNNKIRLPLKLSLLHGSPQNLPEPAPNNELTVLQIWTKSVQ